MLISTGSYALSLDPVELSKEEVDNALFTFRKDSSGTYSYLIDKSSKLCFLVHEKESTSIVPLKCNDLRRIDKIKEYLKATPLKK